MKYETAWIMSRERTMDAQLVKYLRDLLGNNGMDLNLFENVDQQNC